MKKIISWTLLIVVLAIVAFGVYSTISDRVEQKMQKGAGMLCGTDVGGYCYATFVWKDMRIIEVWWDNPYTLTDSIKNKRLQDGMILLNNTKSKTTLK